MAWFRLEFPELSIENEFDRELMIEICGALNTLSQKPAFAIEGDWVKLDWEEKQDIHTLAACYPDILIQLDIDPDNGSLFRLYAKNGKVQYEEAQIVFSPFDAAKLKPIEEWRMELA